MVKSGQAGGLRWISVSGASLSISFGGVDPHLVILPWMPVLPPFLLSFCLVFRSCFLGAMVVASLDFWPNLGLSWLEKATRLSRLEFGRIFFEFDRPVVPDLTTVVGNRCFSASCCRKLLFLRLEPYYRSLWGGTTSWDILPRACHGTTAACQIPSNSYLTLIIFVVFVSLCSFFLVVLRVLVFGSR